MSKTAEELWEEMKHGRAYELSTLKVTPDNPVLRHGGGEWLGTVRNFIQCKVINGEHVIWGSHDALEFRRTLTVSDLEHLASRIAAAAVNEFIEELRRKGVK
jgi:hypothetical protein